VVPVLYPGRLLWGIAGAVAAGRRIGVVFPISSHMESARRNRERDGFTVEMGFASAFGRDEFVRLCGRPVSAALPPTAQVAGEIISG